MTDQFARLKIALADRYEVEHEVGQGGMAIVYLARDPKHQRPVAIKVLHPQLTATMAAARFLREVTIAANLTHPHMLPLHHSGEADGFLFYVMPYAGNVPGRGGIPAAPERRERGEVGRHGPGPGSGAG